MKNRVLSGYTLLFTSISAIIGSGWLFAAYYTSMLAGSSSIISWLLGGLAVLVVAFTFAELSAFVPVTGASIRVPRYTHGVLVGFMFSWILWLSYVSLAPVEIQALIQYCAFFFPKLVYPSGGLTGHGYLWAVVLMFFATIINLYSLRWLVNCNNILTVLKLIIPVVIAAVILAAQFQHHTLNLQAHHESFMPGGIKGILAAITSGGIIFAFNGFKQASDMAGEAKNPHKDLPRAIIGSVLICLVIFLCLQCAFLSTLHSDQDLSVWQTLHLSGITSPFAVILTQSHLQSMLPVLYVGAIVGPFAAALMYCGSSARALYAMSHNETLPAFFGWLTRKGIPLKAIIVNFFVGMCLFAPFPGWNNMANFLTSLMALTYMTAPICVISLRKHLGDQERFFKLPFARLWCFVAFYICSLLLYWSGWQIVSKFYIALLLGLVILLAHKFTSKQKNIWDLDWKASIWVWPYFIGMTIISYYGSFNGQGKITLGWDFLVIAILSSISLWLAERFSCDSEAIKNHIIELKRDS